MAVFKCKMCGGTLEVQPGESVAICDSCGSKQTIPNLSDDRKANLFDRANHFRRANEFDKAMNLYEQILNEDNSDAEAHWGVVLCRYGIEYVEDPATHKRMPTVNRAQFSSVFSDEDYKAAMQYADGYQRDVYEAEAKAIEEIQKGILAISQKEEPFDVFISFKETDANGRRTPDAVLANDLYHQLTQEGFKVFFAPITLEDKLGSEYEPYIFAALNSSKAMVVLGTKPEYFNAVWVKNEWSRYLTLIKNGAKKTLIPAYRDMDPYDLPEEFSHLMAQDMSKLGFMQDLIRGIKKIVSAEEKTAPIKETVTVQNTAPAGNIAPLLERAFMALEDGEWQKADDFCEQVLNQDPKNAQAYLGKLLAELHVRKKADLKNCDVYFENNNNYQRTLKFADDALKQELEDYCASAGKKAEALRVRTEETARKKKKQFSIIVPAIIACVALIFVITKVIIPASKFKNIKVGDYITFGKYEQDNNTSNGKEDIDWLVLDKKDGKILLISKFALDSQAYNTDCIDITWEKCSLRAWLNENFLKSAFNEDEISKIVTSSVSTDKNPYYDTNPGNITKDKLFLLSTAEAENYFDSNESRKCDPTPYAMAQATTKNKNNDNWLWWLRTPGWYQFVATIVSSDGAIGYIGGGVDHTYNTVRPAMWISIE